MYIAIAGNIGSGKTTLTEILTKRYGAKAYYEDLANPYINDFYEDMGRWSFHLQLWFLGSRIQQTLTMLADDADNIIQDRTIYEDAHIFADNLHSMGLMASRDFSTYMKMFNIEQALLPKPDVLIYLKASVPTLISQIKMRGREYEQNIDEDYLSRLNDKYNHWIENIYEGRVLVVDKDTDDFVADPSIIDRICASVEEMCMGKCKLLIGSTMSIALPEKFVETMRQALGEEADSLFAALDTEPVVSIRLNPYKPAELFDGEAIGWSPNGRYLASRPQFTLDAPMHGGAYYVQEASSQFVGYLLKDEEVTNGRVLDMCAAPGGKTTIYSTLVGRGGLVVANDINRGRTLALADNVQRWGLGNVVVTCNEPSHIGAFREWFDVVAVDAPCSGEGMFRKMHEARSEWSPSAPEQCAARQREIVAEAWRTLRRGGVLIYSTCTFNPTEDEGVVEWMMQEYGDEMEAMARVDVEESWGITRKDIGSFQCFHFYPHKARGEGFFAAVVRKSEGVVRRDTPKARKKIFASLSKADVQEVARWVDDAQSMAFRQVGDMIYGYDSRVVDDVTALSESLSVVYSGVAMGQIFKKKLKPEHALALFVGLNGDVVPRVEVSEDDALAYLRRQDISAAQFEEGINLVCCRGVAIGFVKRIGARCNNMYPKDLRILKL